MREQCWLNENLLSCQWVPEGLNPPEPPTSTSDADDAMVTDDDLQAVLKGAPTPLPLLHLA